MNSTRGFTLVELLVTIAVAVILATAAVPSYSRFIMNQRLNAIARDLQNALVLTRSEAIKRNTDVYLINNSSWSDGILISTNNTRTYDNCVTSTNSDCIMVLQPLTNGLGVIPSNSVSSVQYRQNGRLSITGFNFTICPSPADARFQQRIVTVGTTGIPQITIEGTCS